MITITSVSPERYQETQYLYPESNFLQSAQMFYLQQLRQRDMDCLIFELNGQVLGQAVVQYRTTKRVFTETAVLHGPLFTTTDQVTVQAIVTELEAYFQQRKVANICYYPYHLNEVKDDQLQTLHANLALELTSSLTTLGYQSRFDQSQSTVVNTLFVKKLDARLDSKELYEQLSPSLKRDIKKYQALQVKTAELTENELQDFYQILTATAERKGFAVQEFDYFANFKKTFKDQAKFMLAYLDVAAYKEYLKQNIQDFEARIEALETGPQKKRTKGQIADAKDQLSSYYKRAEQLNSLNLTVDKLPLSAYLFICYGKEVISFAGGNDERYINFGGATLIHWEMMQYALKHGFDVFNFYGTTETDIADKGKGNFKFKRQFGGELHVLTGEWHKPLSWFYKLVSKFL